jgi:hypothetical protein
MDSGKGKARFICHYVILAQSKSFKYLQELMDSGKGKARFLSLCFLAQSKSFKYLQELMDSGKGKARFICHYVILAQSKSFKYLQELMDSGKGKARFICHYVILAQSKSFKYLQELMDSGKGKARFILSLCYFTLLTFLYYPTLGKVIMSPQEKCQGVMAWIRTSDYVCGFVPEGNPGLEGAKISFNSLNSEIHGCGRQKRRANLDGLLYL